MTSTSNKWFQSTKKGEIQELRDELYSSNEDKKKEAIKKIISSMTIGKDVSSLFPDVVNCMQTSNIELKKLVYLYVINYAKVQPDLAILAVNTFRKDSSDPNPLIRALAVRTMGCIRLGHVSEYLVEPLHRCCKDSDPYVRKTAVICVAKLFDICPDLVQSQGFIDTLQDMFCDSNPTVVANSLASLSEISDLSGKPILKNILNSNGDCINKLLSSLNECTEWGQVFILDALVLYQPKSSKDAESILERIIPRLSHVNSAVVLSAVKVVLNLLCKITDTNVIKATRKKICPPLITLLSAEPEIQYVVLRNIILIIHKWPGIFGHDSKMFYCKYNDRFYVKLEKLDILVMLASEKNMDEILMEFKEYSTEIDVDFARKSVKCIGRCALKFSETSQKCVDVLQDIIGTRVPYLIQEVIIVMKDILRRYPNRFTSIIPSLCEHTEIIDEPEAKVSLIWMIGEYAEKIENAYELLNSFLGSFHDEITAVQLQIITAVVKLFLINGSNCQHMVSKVLKLATEECDNPDLRDRAYIYWRLLSKDPVATKKVVLADKPPIKNELELLDPSIIDKLIENISMLSSVFHALPSVFVKESKAKKIISDNSDTDSGIGGTSSESEDKQKDDEYKYSDSESSDKASDSGSVATKESDLLEMDNNSDTNSDSKENDIAIIEVLSSGSRGVKSKCGLKVLAALNRNKDKISLYLSLENQTEETLSSWAIQFNKNFFGLTPSSMKIKRLSPKKSCDIVLDVVPNVSKSDSSISSSSLSVQAAIKCSLDVFYFSIPFDLNVVLQESGLLDKNLFINEWRSLGESNQVTLMARVPKECINEIIIQKLRSINIFLVAQQVSDAFETLYFSAKTTNNILILCEIALQKGGDGMRQLIRSETSFLIPHCQSLIFKVLNLKSKMQ